jgi:hypothetical protein
MRLAVTESAALLLLAWGCGGSSNYFEEAPDGSSGKGGTGQGGASQGGSSGAGGTGGASGGTGGSLGTGGAKGGAGGATGGNGGATGGGPAGLGGAGQSGGGAGGMAACSDPDASSGDGTRTRGTTIGANGSFTDSCDASGNLLEHACELGPCISTRIAVPFGGSAGSGGILTCPTGQVISRTVDCGGHCEEGACFGWCAEQGGKFQVTGVEGMSLAMTKDSYEYSCAVVFQREGYDCLGEELVGRTMVVTSLGACTGGSTTWGWDDPESASIQECTFTCTLE